MPSENEQQPFSSPDEPRRGHIDRRTFFAGATVIGGAALCVSPGASAAVLSGEFASIKDFGAVADAALNAGVISGTDNRAAIQAAIDSLPTNGGTVFIPKGKYAFGGRGLFIDKEHVKLVGEGMAANEGAGRSLLGSSMLCYNGTATAINVATQGGAGWSFGTTLAGVELKNFALIGTAKAAGGITWGTASSAVFPIRGVMESVSIFNFAGPGVGGLRIQYLVTGKFTRVYCYNNTDGIQVRGGTTMQFGSIITRINGRYGMQVTSSTNSVTDLTIDQQSVIEGNQDDGLDVLTAGMANGTIIVRDTHFENNCVASGTYQCKVAPSSGSSVTSCFVMDGCRFITTNQTGDLSIDYVTKAKITNTQFSGTGGKIPLKLASTNAAGVVVDTCQTVAGTIDPDGRAATVINTTTARPSWTPVLGGAGGASGQKYKSQVGGYYKIGKLVVASFNVLLSAKGTITGTLEINNLPFTSSASPNGGLTVTYFTALATPVVGLQGGVESGTTRCTLTMLTAAATGVSGMTAADVGNTTQINGVIVYEAAS